jgi:hypothetical protein
MKFIDLLIIYFSIGAPFSVYSYFQTRSEPNRNSRIIRIFFTFLFWLPAAFKLIKNKTISRKAVSTVRYKKTSPASVVEIKLYSIEKQLEKNFRNSGFTGSIYEFRETLERYAGLTLSCKNQSLAASDASLEFYSITENKNTKLAAKCFDRRNRRRLFFHQTVARQDFLQIIADLLVVISDKREFIKLALEFVDLLEDSQARDEIEKMPVENSLAVKLLETDLWKSETRKPLPANSILNLL